MWDDELDDGGIDVEEYQQDDSADFESEQYDTINMVSSLRFKRNTVSKVSRTRNGRERQSRKSGRRARSQDTKKIQRGIRYSNETLPYQKRRRR